MSILDDMKITSSDDLKWDRLEAVELATKIEQIAPTFGCHVALTGGCLYKRGLRKDADFLFYRIRQEQTYDRDGLLKALEAELGLVYGESYGWVTKAKYKGKTLDLFFPELHPNDWESNTGHRNY